MFFSRRDIRSTIIDLGSSTEFRVLQSRFESFQIVK